MSYVNRSVMAAILVLGLASRAVLADTVSMPKADNNLIVEATSHGTLTVTYTRSTGHFLLTNSLGASGYVLNNAATGTHIPNMFNDSGTFGLDVTVNTTPHMTASSFSVTDTTLGQSIFNDGLFSGPNFQYNSGTKEFDLLFVQTGASGASFTEVHNGSLIGVQLFVNTVLTGDPTNFNGDFSASLVKADAFVVAAPLPSTVAAGVMLGLLALAVRLRTKLTLA